MEMAMLLLQAGAEKEFKQKICRRGIWHPPVLGEAVKNKNLEMTQLLLNHGATSKLHPKSKRRGKGGRPRTPGSVLNDCIKDSTPEIAKLLIEHGSNVNAVSAEGNTALYIAASEDSREYRTFVGILIKHEADPNVQNEDSDTPLHIAMRKYDFDVCKILLKAGAKCKISGASTNLPGFLVSCASPGQHWPWRYVTAMRNGQDS
jgi:ankyrin repeat protein